MSRTLECYLFVAQSGHEFTGHTNFRFRKTDIFFPGNYETFEWLGVFQVTKFDVGLVITISNVFL